MQHSKVLIYFREIVVSFAGVTIKCFKSLGLKGVWLSVCQYLLHGVPAPISVPGFGRFRNRQEVGNYIDNIACGELRCEEVEQAIREKDAPAVVDLGVNVGVTVRWWFSLNPAATVVGVDMLQEALDFTTEALEDAGVRGTWKPICAAAGNHSDVVEIAVGDPLSGTSRVGQGGDGTFRKVKMARLDDLLAEAGIREIELLKCDIEGFGGFALEGAVNSLAITRFVVTETHGPEETVLLSEVLAKAGFVVFQVFGRTLWWRKGGRSAAADPL